MCFSKEFNFYELVGEIEIGDKEYIDEVLKSRVVFNNNCRVEEAQYYSERSSSVRFRAYLSISELLRCSVLLGFKVLALEL